MNAQATRARMAEVVKIWKIDMNVAVFLAMMAQIVKMVRKIVCLFFLLYPRRNPSGTY